MKFSFSFFKQAFLFFSVLSALIVINTSLAGDKKNSSKTDLLKGQCSIETLGGEDDLIPWPLPWPYFQCPWNINSLYGDWIVKGVAHLEKTSLKNKPSKNASTKNRLTDNQAYGPPYKGEVYRILNTSMGMSVIKYNSDGTSDKGFVITDSFKGKNNYYKAFMYSANGGVYFLSIYAYLSNQQNLHNKEVASCTNTKKQKIKIKNIIFIRHKVQSFLQCAENITLSWLLEKK